LPLQPKRAIAGLKSCTHGGINHAEMELLGIDPEEILDFSVSTNPFMPPPGIKEMMVSAPVERYPDSLASELRRKLSGRFGVDAANILVGSGMTELIRLIAAVYFRRGDSVLILEPTYGEYEVACRLSGARPVKYRAAEKDGFTPNTEELADIIRQKQPRGVFICNPNNPTGKYLSRHEIEKVSGAVKDGLLILDEAYVPFVEKSWPSFDLTERGNTIVLRSMTKDYGLPGLRLGYAVACREIIDSLRPILPPWNVNAVAQQAGSGVLEQEEYLQESLCKTRKAKAFLTGELTRLGFKVMPSDAHYFLVKVGSAPECRRSLLAKGILVRDCSSFGLPQYIRIAPRTFPECQKLIAAFGNILKARKKNVSEPADKGI